METRNVIGVFGALILAVSAAPGANADCDYNGVTYSEGSVKCIDGSEYVCRGGSWDSTGHRCRDDGPDPAAVAEGGPAAPAVSSADAPVESAFLGGALFAMSIDHAGSLVVPEGDWPNWLVSQLRGMGYTVKTKTAWPFPDAIWIEGRHWVRLDFGAWKPEASQLTDDQGKAWTVISYNYRKDIFASALMRERNASIGTPTIPCLPKDFAASTPLLSVQRNIWPDKSSPTPQPSLQSIEKHCTFIGAYTYPWKVDIENTNSFTVFVRVRCYNSRDPLHPTVSRYMLPPGGVQTVGVFMWCEQVTIEKVERPG